MAEKICFLSENNTYIEKLINYKFYPGFAVSQRQKCVKSLHDSIHEQYPDKRILEISTKSQCELGVRLSAFNLKCKHSEANKMIPVENVFQAAKVFEGGGPYLDLLDMKPSQAKSDIRLKSSGKLLGFRYDGRDWPLEPKTLLYDWIYIEALKQNPKLAQGLLEYDTFTDIEFNHNKSVNCQARAAAIYVSLYKAGLLEEKTKSIEGFQSIYQHMPVGESEQIEFAF